MLAFNSWTAGKYAVYRESQANLGPVVALPGRKHHRLWGLKTHPRIFNSACVVVARQAEPNPAQIMLSSLRHAGLRSSRCSAQPTLLLAGPPGDASVHLEPYAVIWLIIGKMLCATIRSARDCLYDNLLAVQAWLALQTLSETSPRAGCAADVLRSVQRRNVGSESSLPLVQGLDQKDTQLQVFCMDMPDDLVLGCGIFASAWVCLRALVGLLVAATSVVGAPSSDRRVGSESRYGSEDLECLLQKRSHLQVWAMA